MNSIERPRGPESVRSTSFVTHDDVSGETKRHINRVRSVVLFEVVAVMVCNYSTGAG